MSSSDKKDVYRLVPYRFMINESEADICKLEKLTNLFPEMKAIIELELFKINNLQRMIDRLARIYTISTAINSNDDTLHLFLGPYHLLLGPNIFGVLQFRNLSKALLASSHSKTSGENTNSYQKRRHDAAIRRFRRSVRKLILIKSIIDQLRLASILTPYNQYELYRQGVYDLVLAGHIHDARSSFDDEKFTERIKNFRSMKHSEKSDNTLIASKFIKINTLLNLFSPSPQQNQPDNNSIPGKTTQTNQSDNTTNEKSSKSLMNSSNICCSHHTQNTPLLMFPFNRSDTHPPTQFVSSEPRIRRTNKYDSRKTSSADSRRISRNSLPDLPTDDNIDTNIPSNSDKSKNSRLNTNQEDVFVNRISTLLTNYLLSRTNHNHEKLGNRAESFSSLNSEIASDDAFISDSIVEPNEFDKLLQRIKTVVGNNLSDHQNLSGSSTTTTTTEPNNLRRKFQISQESSKDELDIEHSKSSRNKHKSSQLSKAQSFNEINLKSYAKTSESDDWAEF